MHHPSNKLHSAPDPGSDGGLCSRRDCLGGAVATAVSAASGLMPRQAMAADYKALVCLFLYGGNDGMNMVIPTDATRYGQYASVRGPLAVPRGSLVPWSGIDYGLHPSMSALAPAWAEGALTSVFNVGPLGRPMSKTEFRSLASSSALVPSNLYSHSDQQTLWQAAGTNSLARTGWGGRAAQVLGMANPVISLSGGGRFGMSTSATPLQLPLPGERFGVDGTSTDELRWQPMAARKVALEAIYATPQTNVMMNAFARQHRDAVSIADRLATLLVALPGQAGSVAAIDQAFASLTVNGRITTPVAQQLYQIAKLIAGRATVQGDRQIFLASMGGFDTHSGQYYNNATLGHHADLLKQMADAMAAFHQAMRYIGMGPQVTLFTESDFGRTFKPNSTSGTDHAWGNHQLVLGSGVRGKTAYGFYPTLALGGPDDVGLNPGEPLGRWIPGCSVDQYAATLLRWMGATEGQLDTILPNLVNFGSWRSLGFM